MRFFGGLELSEIASALDISERTVKRDWQKARAFRYAALHWSSAAAGRNVPWDVRLTDLIVSGGGVWLSQPRASSGVPFSNTDDALRAAVRVVS
jgi:hypothetical protein